MNFLENERAKEMVACIAEETPYSSAAESFVEASILLPDTPFANVLKTAVCYDVFHATEKLMSGDSDPVPEFIKILEQNEVLLRASAYRETTFTEQRNESFECVEEETGSHYGNLFSAFDDEYYYEEPYKLLHDRFERNGFDFEYAKGKKALDAGCGGGRYTVALRRIGFSHVTGLDYSKEGIESAQKRLERSKLDGLEFKCGNALDLPFGDGHFDFVFSNGVLHHTRDLKKGVEEVLRVLKPGGRGFLYLIEKPGGIFWDVVEILRPLMHFVSYEFARSVFAMMGVPANRRYYILDHIMVPINIRSTPEEVEALLAGAGAVDIRRLERGTDFDRAEKIFNKEPYAEVRYGVGENRYFFKK